MNVFPVKPCKTDCPCGRGPKRTNQQNCTLCNREAQGEYRYRQKKKRETLTRLAMRGIAARVARTERVT
jgi:hypothetical protein